MSSPLLNVNSVPAPAQNGVSPAVIPAAQPATARHFVRGEVLWRGALPVGLWRLRLGTVRLSVCLEPEAAPMVVGLVLKGDLLGFENLLPQPQADWEVVALTDGVLDPVADAQPWQHPQWLMEGVQQQTRRSCDLARVRTGPVHRRLVQLLGLMGHGAALASAAPLQGPLTEPAEHAAQADALRRSLPALKELALLVDAQMETVCRALAQLLPPRARKTGRKAQAAALPKALPAPSAAATWAFSA